MKSSTPIFNILAAELSSAIKVILVLCPVTYALQYFFASTCTWEDIKQWTFDNFYLGLPFSIMNGILIRVLDKKFPWDVSAVRRGVLGVIITIVANLCLTVILLMFKLGVINGGNAMDAFLPGYRFTYLICLIIVVVISLIFYSVGFFKQVQEGRLLNETLRKEKISAELNALKAQVDPHFLFNSFNVLAGLIDEEPNKAQDFLAGLSKIYRYVLENRNEDLVSVEKEMTFARKYIDLQSTRFEESLRLNVDIDSEALQLKLPALSLQLLLENAIKHNAFDKENPLYISIQGHGEMLVVKNNISLRKNLSAGNGLGLENISERYKLHNVLGFSVENVNDSFVVNLPLI